MSTNTVVSLNPQNKSKRFGCSFAKKGSMLAPVNEDQESEYFQFEEEDELESILGQRPQRLSKSNPRKESKPIESEKESNFTSIRWHDEGSLYSKRDGNPRASAISAQSSKSQVNKNRLSSIAHVAPANKSNNRLSSIAHLVPTNRSNNRLSNIAHIMPANKNNNRLSSIAHLTP